MPQPTEVEAWFSEWDVVLSAPRPFVAALLALVIPVGIVIWRVSKGHYARENKVQKATIELQNQRLGSLNDTLEELRQKVIGLEQQIDKSQQQIPAENVFSIERLIEASATATGLREDIEKTQKKLATPVFEPVFRPAHLAVTTGSVEPVPFEGMEGEAKPDKPKKDE